MTEPMVRFKRCKEDRIVTLDVTGDHNEDRTDVVDARYAKFRTNKAMVLEITNLSGTTTFNEARSLHDSKFTYVVGKELHVNWCTAKNVVCGVGIHYYKTKDAAIGHEEPGDSFTGKWTMWQDNGQVWVQGGYERGVRIGEWNWRHDNGQLREQGRYDEQGMRDGEWNGWYDNGQPREQGRYKHGVRYGEWKQWGRTG